MSQSRAFTIVESASAAARLDAAAAFLRQLPATQPVTIVAASRGAADDLARRIARERGATLGMARFSLTQLAARIAAPHLLANGIAPATTLGFEAVAARAVFDAAAAGRLTYLRDMAHAPGFSRALARTLADVRMAHLGADRLAHGGGAGPDLARLHHDVEQELLAARTADRARLFDAAAAYVPGDETLRVPLVLLDLAIESAVDETFVAALTGAAATVFATCPAHDARARSLLVREGGTLAPVDDGRADDLGNLRRYLFDDSAPAARGLDGSLEFFSAPGEGREAVEMARRLLAEAERGVPFDEMAILLRAPQRYHGLLEHALTRAGIPACFERGTRRPHPAGRAFLALIACACEGLSARRFAEYLSLGQLPAAGDRAPDLILAADEAVPLPAAVAADHDGDDETEDEADHEPDAGTLAGTLRAPRQWERLLVEAAVVGGGADRWTRRLDGLARELQTRLEEIRRKDAEAPRLAIVNRELEHLRHLRAFALPLIGELAGWRGAALWGEWLDRLTALAPRVLRRPAHVLRVLADLRPMATVGPVTLDEVRNVLGERLRIVETSPPSRRYGCVFVGSPSQARGRAFRVVFVPGLAERMFPQKNTQDPLLLDVDRERLDADLPTRREQGRRERLLLHLAAGAATERLFVSYPRLDVAQGRARVPSFYALDVLRGATGTIPDYTTLAATAAAAGDPTLAWPAPADPADAIDDQEHDLSVLRTLLDAADPAAVRGHAQYLLQLNPALRRSVTERWARGERKWSQFDGLMRVTDATRPLLSALRLDRRPYSLSALQRFAACPYQFLLGAIYRLAVAERPQPLQRLDPLTRGAIVHRMQAAILRELQRRQALPVKGAALPDVFVVVDDVVRQVADTYRDTLAPAIDRVWNDEIAGIARDLRGWLTGMVDEAAAWTPRYFELAFGLRVDEEKDARSSPEPVTIDGRFLLHGAVDLVEEHSNGAQRVTDYKTGKDRTREGLMIGGGETLQPVLYSMAVEQVMQSTVTEARLLFCTSAGGYRSRTVPLTPLSRRAGVEALEIVDRAIEQGFLAAAPREGACARCDFRPVCGPAEEQRVVRKPLERLRDLVELRSRP